VIDQYRGAYYYYGDRWSPASVDFMLFTSLWTLLAVAYLLLVPTRFPKFAHKFAIAAVEFITMIFWFAAFVAVAVRWGDAYRGVDARGTFYGCGVAAIVFSAFLWLVLCCNFYEDTANEAQAYLCCHDRSVRAAHPQLVAQRYLSSTKHGWRLKPAMIHDQMSTATRTTEYPMIPFSFYLLPEDCYDLARRMCL
jgi:hypothetical protein